MEFLSTTMLLTLTSTTFLGVLIALVPGHWNNDLSQSILSSNFDPVFPTSNSRWRVQFQWRSQKFLIGEADFGIVLL